MTRTLHAAGQASRMSMVPVERASCSARRGFVFLVVLLVFTIAVILIGAGVERAGVEGAVVQRQLDRYQRYHEMLGAQDIISTWISKPQSRDLLYEASRSDSIAYSFTLPDGTVFAARIKDGQGTLLNRVDLSLNPESQERLRNALMRIGSQRQDLLRRSGPPTISLQSAPDEVLSALANGDAKLGDLLASLRAEQQMDPARLTTVLNNSGYGKIASELSQLLTFNPTLWRVDVEVIQGVDAPIHRYRMLFGPDTTGLGTLAPLECRALAGEGFDDPDNGDIASQSGTRGNRSGPQRSDRGGIAPASNR